MAMAASKRRRRAYIGNLRPRPNLLQTLHTDLIQPHCLQVNNYPEGNGIIIGQPKTAQKVSSAFALVEFVDVDYAIQVLNGVMFDGRTLRVCREKTNLGGAGGGGGWSGGGRKKGASFGSSRWAGDEDNDDRTQHRHHSRRKNHQQSLHSVQTTETGLTDQSNGVGGEESVTEQVKTMISNEIKESEDEVTAAIACTAAMTLLSSVDAFGLAEDSPSSSNDNNQHSSVTNAAQQNDMTNNEFKSRCNLPMSELLAEYGEQDVHWKTNKPAKNAEDNDDSNSVPFKSRLKPLSDLLTEYGEQDVDWKKQQHQQQQEHDSSSRSNSKQTNSKKQSNKTEDNGMLAPFGKAPIHLEIMSFGYKYNAPKNSKGFSYAHPLPPIDIRDLDRAPGSVSKFNGLSYLVKRSLLNPSKASGNDDNANENEDDDDGSSNTPTQSPMRQRTNAIADEIIKVLVEAIDEGEHSAINPLTMTVSIGSEYGRHRAVVLVEHLAVVLRARLRRNDGKSFTDSSGSCSASNNGIVKQPVSVGTRHRDVEAHHKDEEAFGEDLKRQERAAEKAKRKEAMELNGWDDGSSW
eukprot:scaffold29155_cov166-Skeletonema_menzelii.AAC.4